MSQTQDADTQVLPRAGSTRRCPKCDAPAMQIKRWPQASGVWQVSCTQCGHSCQERTARNIVDSVLESRQRVVVVVALCLVAATVAVFGGYSVWMFARAIGLGRPGAIELCLLFIAAFLFTVGAAYAWRNSINGSPDRVE